MSIEHFTNHSPFDEQVLEQIANDFFRSAPGDRQSISELPNYVHNQPNLELPVNFQRNVDANVDKTKDNNGSSIYAGTSKIPQSVAGSGVSPSLTSHQNGFKIDDPQTSLPDPHFYNGQIPKSVAGSGKQPSLNTAGSQNQNNQTNQPVYDLPFAYEDPYETKLQSALNNINLYQPGSQLPINPVNAGSSQKAFYFLNEFTLFDPGNTLKNVNTINVHGVTNIVKAPFDVNFIRADFPILKERVNGKPLIWFDNAATTQKPQQVIDRISHYYAHENSNIHRAAHELAARSTDAYEDARKKVKEFLNASSVNEIVFVRGTTEAINLVAFSWGEQNLKEGDEIIISQLEHHANIVPWQMIAAKKGAKIKVIPTDESGQLIIEEYEKLLSAKTKLVTFTQVSNALGTITPAKAIIEKAHAVGAKVLLDGAQSVSHIKTDLQYLNPDWFVFSGHKVFAPTGIGILYGKEDLLNETQPWQGGGHMIKDVTFEHTVYNPAPTKFEAGTGNIADAVGLGAALDYVSKIGINLIYQYEHALLEYATHLLKSVPGVNLVGTAANKTSVASFVLQGFKNDEVGKALNQDGIAVRTGHHCAQPILRRFGLESTVRPSLAFYNTCAEVDALISSLYKLNDTKNNNFYFIR